MANPLSIKSMNHVSRICRSVEKSLDFYQNVLGFISIKRPESFNFNGAWLFNYGIGIHLLKSADPENMPKITKINPKDNHISFQCAESMETVEERLKEMKIPYERRLVEDDGVFVDQIFFHDPDGFMIEICNCENIPVIPLNGELTQLCSKIICNTRPQQVQQPEQIIIPRISALQV